MASVAVMEEKARKVVVAMEEMADAREEKEREKEVVERVRRWAPCRCTTARLCWANTR